MRKKLTLTLLSFGALLCSVRLSAQCFSLSCSGTSQIQCDYSDNDPLLWKANNWLDAKTGLHDLPDAEDDLALTVDNPCNAQLTVEFELYFDLDNDGSLETKIASKDLDLIPPGFVPFNNVPDVSKAEYRRFDNRQVAAAALYRFALEKIPGNNTATYHIRWNTPAVPDVFTPVMRPYGFRKVKWFVHDQMGNAQWCDETIEARDCKKPAVVCINGITVSIMPVKFVTLWDTDFLQYTTDNHTPNGQLVTAIRKASTGTGFPVNPDGSPAKSVSFTCDELGIHNIELWSKDQYGNADYCETFVIVQDNAGFCNHSGGLPVTICASTCSNLNKGIVNYIYGSSNALPPFFWGLDTLYFNACKTVELSGIPFLGNYYLAPNIDNDPLNGVSAYDLIQIEKYIDGQPTLNSPYKIIAADANNSRSVTGFDLVELQKLILGIYTELPNNTSWRFVDGDYVFPDSLNPFTAIFPETVPLNLLDPQDTIRFEGMKIGDVSCNTASDSVPHPYLHESLPKGPDFCIGFPKTTLQTGETLLLPVTAATSADLLGWQFDLHLGVALKVTNLVPAAGLDNSNFGVFTAGGFISSCWHHLNAVHYEAGDVLFYLNVVALEPVETDTAVQIKSNRIWPDAFADSSYQPITLCFTDFTAVQQLAEKAPVLLQPNPATDFTEIAVSKDAAGLQWEILDQTGKILLANKEGQVSAGQLIAIPLKGLPAGVYTCRILLGTELITGKLLKL